MLLAAEGLANQEIARRVGVSRTTVESPGVIVDRARGLDGLEDAERPGRPRKGVGHAAVVTATLTPPPRPLGVTHWSTRLLAPRLGVCPATVARAWRAYRGQGRG